MFTSCAWLCPFDQLHVGIDVCYLVLYYSLGWLLCRTLPTFLCVQRRPLMPGLTDIAHWHAELSCACTICTEVCRISATRALTCNSLSWAMLSVMIILWSWHQLQCSECSLYGRQCTLLLQRFCKPLYLSTLKSSLCRCQWRVGPTAIGQQCSYQITCYKHNHVPVTPLPTEMFLFMECAVVPQT